jgi:hypothetical protein
MRDDESGRAPSPEDLVAWAQELVDAAPGHGGYSLDWAVPASVLGDMTVLATLSLRSER